MGAQPHMLRREMVAVLPDILRLGCNAVSDLPPTVISAKSKKKMPLSIIRCKADSVTTDGQVVSLLHEAMKDEGLSLAMEIVVAHIIAEKALSDPFWRMDRYKTRIDEYLMTIFIMAQHVYEANAALQLPYDGSRFVTKGQRRRGLGLHGEEFISGLIPEGCRR